MPERRTATASGFSDVDSTADNSLVNRGIIDRPHIKGMPGRTLKPADTPRVPGKPAGFLPARVSSGRIAIPIQDLRIRCLYPQSPAGVFETERSPEGEWTGIIFPFFVPHFSGQIRRRGRVHFQEILQVDPLVPESEVFSGSRSSLTMSSTPGVCIFVKNARSAGSTVFHEA